MTVPDLVNGAFESLSSIAVWWNVKAIARDRCVKGFSVVPMAFFTLWGYWNLYYYPHLHQLFSFLGGLSMVVANTTYLLLVFKYYD